MDSPIFIVGANRSGTTLLRLILNAHPRVGIPDELVYFDTTLAGVSIHEWNRPGLGPSEFETFVESFLQERAEIFDALDRASLKAEILDGAADLRRPYQISLRAWAEHHGKNRWGEKTPGNLFYADVIREMFPDARFVYVARDPRAGVASMQSVSFFPNDVVFNALSRRKHDIAGRDFFRSQVPAAQRTTLRYEDLVRQPERVVRSLCEFLGEAYHPEMLHFHRQATKYMRDAAEEGHNATATKPITTDRLDAWMDEMAEEDIAAVESLCDEVFRRFGYTPSGYALSFSRRAVIRLKRMYWMLQCWRHRNVRQYTVKDPVLARTRNRIDALHEWFRRRLQVASPFHST